MPRPRTVSSLRARLLAALGCATLVALTDTPARALSCSSLPWEPEDRIIGSVADPTDVPVDVALWELRSCAYGLSRPSGCRLEAGGVTIPMDIQVTGTDGCDVAYEDREGDNFSDVIVHYVPAQPLEPGRTYVIECDAGDPRPREEGPIEVRVRDSDAPAAPPGSLADAEVELKRGDDGCCGIPSWIAVTVDLEAPYLREGGYIEATYVNGQVVAAGRPELDGTLWFPPTREPLELTPVAADGTRGETIRLERGDIDRELIYIPCAVTDRPSPLALWLLAPLAWIRVQSRRRRGTRGGA